MYPPQVLLVLLPFAPMPGEVAAVLATVGMLALLGLTLYVLGIRDVRCYAAALLWVPVISGVLLANISIPLAFALAVLWRYRNARWPPAVALGIAVSAKLLLWPMFVWMLATRRFRTTVWAVLVGLGATFGAWAAIGFDGLGGYPDLLRRLSEIQAERSYSIVGMTATFGLGEVVGQALALAIGLGLLVCVLSSRAAKMKSGRSRVQSLRRSRLSPIVWLHYLVALLVPMAIARPRFSLIWLLPVLLWVSPRPGYAEGVATFMPAIAAAILLTVLLARPRTRHPIAELAA